jgi:2-iminoacetate synthase ThiH
MSSLVGYYIRLMRNIINETDKEAELSIKTKPKKILNSTRCGVDDIGGTEYETKNENI